MNREENRPVAIVTAGGARVGQAISLAFARSGYDLVLHYRTLRPSVDETRTLAEAAGASVKLCRADLCVRAQAESVVEAAVAQFGRVDVLVANAGAFQRTPVENLSEEACQRMLDDNLFATLWIARAAGLWMRRHSGGSIVAVADVAALRPWQGYLAYNIAKAGVVTLVRTLAKELAPEVRVNAVAPGPVLFPPGSSPELVEREIARTLLKRAGSPEAVADAVLFLCKNDYVTGVILPVDGGRLLGSDDGY
ncbi:MAG: oxidoreductase [Candidatus Binatia bacterium]|nr:MAG: oxidoreductase [Candidatus Binatia bacterium]